MITKIMYKSGLGYSWIDSIGLSFGWLKSTRRYNMYSEMNVILQGSQCFHTEGGIIQGVQNRMKLAIC